MNAVEKTSPAGRRFATPLKLPVLLAGALLAVCLFQGSRGLYETTEGRYAECAREMARQGSWLTPVLNGEPHWTKPPLTYLAIAVPCKFFGPSTICARLYLIPCYLAAIFAAWWLGLRLWRDPEMGRVCATVSAASGLTLLASHTTSTDYPLAVAVALSQAAFWEAFRTRKLWAVYAFWLFTAVAFLTKGPPALLYLPAAVVTWLRLSQADRRQVRLFTPPALALFLLVSLSWYAWEAWRNPGLLGYWVNDEVVNRSFSSKYHRNPEFYANFVIYLPILLLATAPWNVWLLARWRTVWQHVWGHGGWRRWFSGLSDEALWLAWSVGFPLAVFSLSKSKLPLYLLPLCVAIAVAMGRLFAIAYGQKAWAWKALATTWCATLVVFSIGKGVYAFYPSDRDMKSLYRNLAEHGKVPFERVSVFGDKPLNGLSYYCDRVLPLVSDAELERWAGAAGGERFLVCSHGRVASIKSRLAGAIVADRDLEGKWHLLSVNPAPAATGL